MPSSKLILSRTALDYITQFSDALGFLFSGGGGVFHPAFRFT